MKKILAACLALYFIVPTLNAQEDEIRRSAIGISFFVQDFETAQRIRTTSLNAVLRDKQWAKIKEMSPGLAIHYFKGLRKHMDFEMSFTESLTCNLIK